MYVSIIYNLGILLLFNSHKVQSQCSTPPSISNGVATAGTYAVGSTAIYTCQTGYVLTDTVVTCVTSGGVDQWSSSRPTCVCNDDSCRDIPVWAIATMAVLGALLLAAIVVLVLLPCCCCPGCPCYCLGNSKNKAYPEVTDNSYQNDENHYYNNADRHPKRQESLNRTPSNKAYDTVDNHHYRDSENGKILKDHPMSKNEHFEYYYDIDRGMYVNPHTGAKYYKDPDKGTYLGKFSSKTEKKDETFVVEENKPEPHKPQPITYTTSPRQHVNPSPAQILVMDTPRHEKQAKPTTAVSPIYVTPEQQHSQSPPHIVVVDKTQEPKIHQAPTQNEPKYVVVDERKGAPQPKEPATEYVVVSSNKTAPRQHQLKDPEYVIVESPVSKRKEPEVVVVDSRSPRRTNVVTTQHNKKEPEVVVVDNRNPRRSKKEPEVVIVNGGKQYQKDPEYVLVNNKTKANTLPRQQAKPHVVVVNGNRPNTSMDDTHVVYLDDRKTLDKQKGYIHAKNRPYDRRAEGLDSDGYDPDDYYVSEPEPITVIRRKHNPSVRYKFQTAIDRVMGVNKFRKPVQRKIVNGPPGTSNTYIQHK